MTLRSRLFVSSLAVALPLAVGLFLIDERFRLADMEQTLRRFVQGEMTGESLARCQQDPFRFGKVGPPPPLGGPGERGRGGPGREDGPPGRPPRAAGPYDLFVYNRDLSPVDPRAPAMPDELRTPLVRGEPATTTFASDEGRGIAIGMPFGQSDTACAFLLARMRPRPGVLRDQLIALALVIVSVLAAAWISAGPVIGRLRRLAEGAHRSAESYYEQSITVGAPARDEVDDLARAFNTAGARVREHLLDVQARRESLRRFVANTTHDVALPLTVLQGHLADLERAIPRETAEHAHVREAIEEAHYMSSLLRNLGMAAALDDEAIASAATAVDLSALVERVAARHRAIARARGVTFEPAVPEAPVIVTADLTLLEQAISNLADNAVQYNSAGGHAALVLDRRGSNRFVLTVIDDGPGVAEADLARMTERRFRGSEARTRRPDGQGLGLSIVAEASARLGFTLRFAVPPEGGLAATIEGPLLAAGGSVPPVRVTTP